MPDLTLDQLEQSLNAFNTANGIEGESKLQQL